MSASPKVALRRIASLALLASAMLTCTSVAAEGSRSLYPAGYNPAGWRANLDVQGSLTTSCTSGSVCYAGVVRRNGFLYVYAQAGEYLLLGSHSRNAGGDIRVYNPQAFGTPGNETRPASADFTCSAAGGGYIADRKAELAGPNSADGSAVVTNGYTPCAYQAPADGIYGIQFTAATSGPGSPNGVIDPPDVDTVTVSAWDVTVRANASSTIDLDGRLFTYAFVGFTGGNSRPLYSSLHYVTADGYRYRQDLRGLDPNGFALYGNVAGFLDNGNPLYKDIRGSEALVTTLPAGVASENAQFPIFFSDATPAGPNEAEIAKVLGALGVSSVPPVPVVSSVSFQGNIAGSQSSVGAGGNFTFTSTNTITYQIVISADGADFDPATTTNRVLTGFAPSGSHSIYWDGKDNAGNDFPPNTIALPAYPFRLTGRNGEIHFPIIDSEGNGNGGPTIVKLNGTPGSTVYYDDRGYLTTRGSAVGVDNGFLCGAASPTPPTPNVALLGVDSNVATFSGHYYRYWPGNGNANSDCSSTAGFGDAKGLNVWAFESTASRTGALDIVATSAGVDVGVGLTVASSVLPGATANGNLVFRNDGASATATGVSYAFTLGSAGHFPTAASFPTLPGTTYDPATGVVAFSGLPALLAVGQSIAVPFSYTAPVVPGTVAASATIGAGNESVGAPSPNSASGSTTIMATTTDLAVDVAGPASAGANGSVTYTLTITNNGPADVTNAVVKDAAVANFTAGGVSCGSEAGGAICPLSPTVSQLQSGLVIPTLPSGAALVVTVFGTAAASGAIANAGTIAVPAGIADTNAANDSDSANTLIVAAPTASPDTGSDVVDGATGTAGTNLLANDSGTGLALTAIGGCVSFPCTLAVKDVGNATLGSVVVQGDGNYVYTASAVGTSTAIAYTVVDSASQSASGALTLTSSAPAGPVAVDDSGTTPANQPLVQSTSMLANDSGTGVALVSVTGVATCAAFPCTIATAHGSIVVAAAGTYVYTPAANYSGPDAFTYQIRDVAAQTASGSVAIAVTPVASPDSGSDVVDGPSGTAGANLLSNDFGSALVVASIGGCSTFPCTVTVSDAASLTLGTLVVQSDGSYVYTATAPGTSIAIGYTVRDTSGQTASASLVLTSSSTPPPIATNDTGSGSANSTITGGSTLANDSGTGIALVSVTGTGAACSSFPCTVATTHGSVVVQGDGSFVYTPNASFSGTDSFSYTIRDAVGRTASATVTLTIAAVSLATAQPIPTLSNLAIALLGLGLALIGMRSRRLRGE